uniref:DNA polymerase n=2 Tax=Hymenochaetaceae TaxID=40424 RepID=UPI00233EE466|nr:DNA polymerase [Phellinus igniarius]WBU93174.1 DNA polymerase [Phellinus igniarius]
MELLSLSYYDGSSAKSFYITDYNSVKELIFEVLRNLLIKANSGKIIYIHNSSNFDLIFLLKHIANYPEVELEPIIKDGKFINLKIRYGSNKTYFINLKDSLLLLPVSLRKLAVFFKVDTLKSIFPYSFVNKDNLNFIGDVPSIEYFDNISIIEYNQYKARFNNNWSLKSEVIKYCEIDCIALYKVIECFAKFIFDLFELNISSVSTLPSLAFKIFRTHFLKKMIFLPIISGKIYDDIRNAYYGGHVDMYIPKNIRNKLVYHYDVNGLYPHAMRAFNYPTEIFAHFVGDISKMDQFENLFKKYQSFIKVKVTAPLDIKHPILPFKTNGTTVYGVGSWVSWYHSNEIRNAIKYGYRFKILEGYLFESADLFSAYVEKLHAIKEQYSSDHPMYLIAKLLLNSLSGRFGMAPKMLSHIVLSEDQLSDFVHKIGLDNLVDQVKLENNIIVSYWLDNPTSSKTNIAIAASITANARVHMCILKNNPKFEIYYTDTDSGFLDQPLPAHLVDDKKLGLFKLERVLSKFIALSPKVYGGIDLDGTEFTKVKGLKTKVTVSQLEELLIKDNLTKVEQEKQFNNLTKATISVKDVAYSLKPTDSKRNLIFRKGILVATSSKIIKEN